jgi:DNA topoisomerase-1
MPTLTQQLSDLYADPKQCAKLVGLEYIQEDVKGMTRARHGKGFGYLTVDGKPLTNEKIKQEIIDLVIPPAWENVWISPSNKGHVLATGIDEKGRKQYIYNPTWRTMRDLIKFYRTLVFAQALPKIRKDIDKNLANRTLTHEKVIAIMLWILDNSYIRIGNDSYFELNESVGLTTLTDKNVVIAGPVVTLAFKGKSSKDQQITFENLAIAKVLDQLRQVRGARLFRYQDAAEDWHAIDSEDINKYLHELTGLKVSAKDFRTWGGTLMAFLFLIRANKAVKLPKPEKVAIQAIDQAAAVLGNTRSVARSSYVHPHILATYMADDFDHYYHIAQKQRKVVGLDIHESELLHVLEQLFADKFTLLKDSKN